MEVSFPEPVNIVQLYNLEQRSIAFKEKHELRDYLKKIKRDLDVICDKKLVNESSVVFSYQIIFYRGDIERDDFVGKDFLSGGADLSVGKHRNYFISEFKQRYLDLFKKVLRDYHKKEGEINL